MPPPLSHCVAVAFALSGTVFGGDLFPETNYRTTNCVGAVTVQLESSETVTGKPICVDAIFECISGYCDVDSKFWGAGSEKSPMRMAVFNHKKELLGWVESTQHPSGQAQKRILSLRQHNIIGVVLQVPTGSQTTVNENGKLTCVGPGDYYLQAHLTGPIDNRSRDESVASSFPVALHVSSGSAPTADDVAARKPKGRLQLLCSKSIIRVGGELQARVTFANTSGETIAVFNPFAKLQGRYTGTQVELQGDIGEFDLVRVKQPVSGLSRGDVGLFIDLSPNAIVGSRFKFMLDRYDSQPDSKIPPGVYSVAAVLTDRFFSFNRHSKKHSMNSLDWLAHFEDQEVLRSTTTVVHIVP